MISRALEAVLQPLFEDVVVLWCCADRAWIFQAIDADVGLKAHPIVQIPVHTEAEFISVPVKGGKVLRRLHVVEENTRLVSLDSRITEGNFPGSPTAVTTAGSFRTEH